MTKLISPTFIDALPFSLRGDIQGYIASVDDVKHDIFASVGFEFSDELYEQLIFIAAIRRLWSIIDNQYWTIDNTLALGRRYNIGGIIVGRSRYTPTSSEYIEVRELRKELEQLLVSSDFRKYIDFSSLSEILLALGGK
jgi:hypothetical protein